MDSAQHGQVLPQSALAVESITGSLRGARLPARKPSYQISDRGTISALDKARHGEAAMSLRPILGIGLALVLPALGLAFAPRALAADKVWQIGWLDPNPPPISGKRYGNLDAFRDALGELGYAEGRNYVIEGRFANTDAGRVPTLAAELVDRGVDIIVTIGTPTVVAAKNATSTIPIVMAGSADPVEHGLVASLAHPAGNVTGVTHSPGPSFSAKSLEILKDVAPNVSRVAILWDSTAVHEGLSLEAQRTVAGGLHLTLFVHDVKDAKSAEDFDSILAAINQEGADALFVFPNFINGKYGRKVTEFALQHRLPSMYQDTWYVEVGGLISYYTDWLNLRRRAAIYVDRILKGVKPADLPVEEPTKFELVVNLRTAEALGLSIPQSVLVRADRVIE
jgi:putative ABC transport system substrate-binding protein